MCQSINPNDQYKNLNKARTMNCFNSIAKENTVDKEDLKNLLELDTRMNGIIDQNWLDYYWMNIQNDNFQNFFALQILLLRMLMERTKDINADLFWILWVRGILVSGYLLPIGNIFFPQLNVIPVAAVAHWAIVVALILGILIELRNIARAAVRIYEGPEEDKCLVKKDHHKSRQVFRIIHLLIDIVKLALFSCALFYFLNGNVSVAFLSILAIEAVNFCVALEYFISDLIIGKDSTISFLRALGALCFLTGISLVLFGGPSLILSIPNSALIILLFAAGMGFSIAAKWWGKKEIKRLKLFQNEKGDSNQISPDVKTKLEMTVKVKFGLFSKIGRENERIYREGKNFLLKLQIKKQ